MGKILAFVSGKGGTGKTSMCAAIAVCLAARKKSVLCVDLDVGLRNLDLALGLTGEPLLPFTSLADGTYDFDHLFDHPSVPGLKALTAPVSLQSEEVDAEAFRALCEKAAEVFDFVLLDAPAGIGTLFRLAVDCCHEAVVVTGGDKAALRDGAQAARFLGGKPARILVNRVEKPILRKLNANIDDMMDEISLPLLGIVPEDRNVPLAAGGGQPLILQSRRGAALACLRISGRLMGLKEPLRLR